MKNLKKLLQKVLQDLYRLDNFIDQNISKNKKSYSRKGKHVDINIFDTSNIKEALNELEQLQDDFSKELNKD